jgi:hypothetical protein
MVVVPGAIASTLPAADICATLTSLLLQFTARLLSVAPAASRSNAVYPDAAPGVNVVTPVTTTDATGIGITVIAAEPDFPSLVAVIVAVPTDTLAITPLASTDATAGADELHDTARPVSTAPAEVRSSATALALCPS